METTRIFPPTIRSSCSQDNTRAAFTLVELLVVVALIGLIAFFSLPTISSMMKVSISSATRELASTIKEAYNSSVVTGKVHRLAYDLEKNQFWVESGPSTLLMDTSESKEKEARRKKFAKPGEEKPKSVFSLEKSVTRNKLSLPRGVTFEDVVTEQTQEPISKGLAYTHFFPHGQTEQTIIHIIDAEKHQASLVISTLIGKTQFISGYVKGEDLFGKTDSR